jgi:RNA polymerase sigma-70 factor (ECF subfamily)
VAGGHLATKGWLGDSNDRKDCDVPPIAQLATLSDADVVERVRGGEPALFEILMRRHNQRIYRAVRAVLKDEVEVEDVMQQAYINAFTHLDQFEERAQFSTWLTRIALNEAFRQRRKMRTSQSREELSSNVDADRGDLMDTIASGQPDPERQAYAQEISRMLEDAVDALPDTYRTVFMLRDIEGLSTSETGAGLGIGEEAVKTRGGVPSPCWSTSGRDGAFLGQGAFRIMCFRIDRRIQCVHRASASVFFTRAACETSTR